MGAEQLDFFGMANGDGALREETLPVLHDSTWGKAEALVFARHLKRGDLSNALEVLGALTNDGARAVLMQAGFSPRATGGRQAMLESVQNDLILAAREKKTGVELRASGQEVEAPQEKTFPGAVIAPSITRALESMQRVLSAPVVEIGVAGSEQLDKRQSLLFIGGQAIGRGISGFGIEGVEGKFQLPESVDLAAVRSMYGAAGAAMAEAEVRGVMPKWAAEKGVPRLSELVPEATAKVLRGPVSVDGAKALQAALNEGMVSQFGAEQGVRLAGQVLFKQGVRIDALPLEQIVEDEGLRLIKADRGQYVGPVVLQDHRASALKASRDTALVVAHKDLPEGMNKPNLGDTMKVSFRGGQMSVDVQERSAGKGVGR